MHPVHYLFEDIYRNHWGIPQSERRNRKHHEAPAWKRWLAHERNAGRK